MHSQGSSWRAIGVLWGAVPVPVKGPQARFSLAEVARAGVALADRVGLEGITMAAVASELGLTTTALYRYVDAKETLVEVMVDEAVDVPPALAGCRTWQDGVRRWAAALLDVHLAHPWLCDVKPGGAPRCPNGMAWYASILPVLDDAPFADPTTFVLELNLLLRGYAALSHSVRPDEAPPPWFAEVVAERFPRLVDEARRSRGSVVEQFWIAFDRLIAASA